MSSSDETADITSLPTSPESDASLNEYELSSKTDVCSAPLKKRKMGNFGVSSASVVEQESDERVHKKPSTQGGRKGKNYYVPTKEELMKYVGLQRFTVFFLSTKNCI